MSDRLDVAAIRRWCDEGIAALRRHRDAIDDLNVFPVPDGDTGTNLLLTTVAAVEALEGALAFAQEDGAGAALLRLARGALLGARGNSGVILAQFFRGFADSLGGLDAADGQALAKALSQGCEAAYRAVAAPVEGTILTVAAQAAAAATEVHSRSVVPVAEAAARAARAALAMTPLQLPDLARAGVLDAGGMGLAVLLNALVEAVGGRAEPAVDATARGVGPLTVAREAGSDRFAYEVQYLLEADASAIAQVRRTLCELGDSVAIVGGDNVAGRRSTWNVHVHVNEVGAAIEAGVEAGRPYRISVTRFAKQAMEGRDFTDPGRSARGRAVVVLCDGDGLAALFKGEGAAVVPLDQGRLSPELITQAILASGASEVIVLPNLPMSPEATAETRATGDHGPCRPATGATDPAVDQAVAVARDRGIRATVVPTRSPVQALAALAVHDPSHRFDDDVITMAEAAGGCRHAELIRAAAEALTVVGRCAEGDILALVDGEVNLIGQSVLDVGLQLLDRLLTAGGELVTLVTGQDAPKGTSQALAAHLRERWPFVDVQWYVGNQPDSPLLIGVE